MAVYATEPPPGAKFRSGMEDIMRPLSKNSATLSLYLAIIFQTQV